MGANYDSYSPFVSGLVQGFGKGANYGTYSFCARLQPNFLVQKLCFRLTVLPESSGTPIMLIYPYSESEGGLLCDWCQQANSSNTPRL